MNEDEEEFDAASATWVRGGGVQHGLIDMNEDEEEFDAASAT